MILKRAFFIPALVIPPALGLTGAAVLGWLHYEPSLRGVLIVLGAYAAWGALVGVGVVIGVVRKGRPSEPPALAPRAPAPRAVAPYLVPPLLERFVGREEEIGRLERALKPGRIPVITGVVGLEGIGKTELAKMIAHRVAGHYRDGVLWADCGHQELATVADLWAAAYGVQLAGDDFDSKAAAWRSLIGEKEALLIFDDIQPGQDIEALFPPPGYNMVLITTRDGHYPALQGVVPVQVGQFSDDEATELAARVLGREEIEAQRAGAKLFFELVGYLPLAVSIGLHMARDRGWSLAELSRELERAGAIRALGEPEVRKSVEATFQMAWYNLPSDLQRVFAALAVFNQGPSFDAVAMAAVLDTEELQARELLNRLVGRSLLTAMGEGRWALHPLLREFLGEKLPADDPAWRRMAAHYVQVARVADGLYLQGGEDALRGLSLFDLGWPHIQAGQAWSAAHAEADEEAAKLCSVYPDAAVYCLTLRLHRREQVVWLEAAARAARHLEDRAAESNHLANLGSAYAALGEVREAIGCYQQALDIAREIGDRRGEGHRLGQLGLARAALGEVREAIGYTKQALEIAREIGDRQGEGSRLHNLARAYLRLGEVREAIGYTEQALEIAREIGDRRMEGHRLADLGRAYAALGEVREAIGYTEQALEIAREIGNRRMEGTGLGQLGLAYAALGEAREAMGYYEQALEIAREIGDRRGEGARLGNLGLAHAALGEMREARGYYEQALEIAREIGDRRMEGTSLGQLGLAYAALGEVQEAIGVYEQGLEIAREIGDRRGEANRLANMGQAYRRLGHTARARGLWEEALGIYEAMEDPNADRVRRWLKEIGAREIVPSP